MSIIKKTKQILGWEYRNTKPEFDLNSEIYSQLKPFRLPLVLVQLIMMIGTVGYILIDDFEILDAIYQTGITFTTVGFGEIAPISDAGRFFTITLIIFGFGIFTLSTAILIDTIIKGRLFDLYKERRMLYNIARLRNHFVIFHHNEYTEQLAKQFIENHIPFVVVDPRDDMEQIAKENHYPYFLKEKTFTEKAFLKSHLSSAKGVISLSKDISDNITIIASVRLHEKELKRKNPFLIICNAETQHDVERLRKLGANKVVAPPSLMAKRVSAMAIRPDMENVLEEFLYKKDTPIDMEEIYINDDSLEDYDYLVKMALIHFQFESIHPFYDGNGRSGRILNVLYLVLKDLLELPILYVGTGEQPQDLTPFNKKEFVDTLLDALFVEEE